MEIHVIRHTPVAVQKGICYGQLDVDVADTFVDDVGKISIQLDTDYDAIFCSPLSRCLKLSKALHLEGVRLDKRLMEFDYGDWEGKKWEDIPQEKLQPWMDDFVNQKIPNGESLRDIFHRVEEFITTLRTADYKKVLLVTHGGVIRCLWASILEIPLQNLFKVPVGFHEKFVFNLGTTKELDGIIRKG
ncbi:histidine phosphatase family protein [Flammeovirga agarivorans]|uniref:Alpha-ribazole phosphatase n=1 Tax=Flammeovirga agarivorans TaxID=2726742 RepID=A0A7X8SQC6_9BACT|nr:histidine phosphatase family protein [Flammeovirga agarivorans]NLR94470.1 alpha-ribazole phosphatase [Flammeovirga agarivorans]